MAEEYGRGYVEITDRQDFQLHWINGEDAQDVFAQLEQIGFATDKCGQAYPGARYGDVRNVVGCPVAGIDADEVFDASQIVREVTDFFTGNRAYLDLPRKFKMSISGCAINCTASEIQDLAFTGVRHPDGRVGFSLFGGGGVGAGPRLADAIDVFVEPKDVLQVARGFVDVYKENGPREAKAKARFKWLVQAWGPEKLRSMVEQKIGKRLEDFERQVFPVSREHVGVRPQKQGGYSYVTVPVIGGILSSRLMLRFADIAERYAWPEVRLTAFQNLVMVGIENNQIAKVVHELREMGFNVDDHPVMWTTIACAGNFCGKAPEDPKARAIKIVEHLKSRLGTAMQDVDMTIAVSGCPNGCARHLVADIGLQAVQMKKDVDTIPAYNLYLGGGLGKRRSLATLVKRAAEADGIESALEKIIAVYVEMRKEGESFCDFCHTRSDHDLVSILSGNVEQRLNTDG
jgi:sulfite reductase beta subunit-like hemoprotein